MSLTALVVDHARGRVGGAARNVVLGNLEHAAVVYASWAVAAAVSAASAALRGAANILVLDSREPVAAGAACCIQGLSRACKKLTAVIRSLSTRESIAISCLWGGWSSHRPRPTLH